MNFNFEKKNTHSIEKSNNVQTNNIFQDKNEYYYRFLK